MKVFICAFLVGISFLAVAIVLTFLLLKLLTPKSNCDYFLCIPCDATTKNIRQKLYSARLKLNLCGENSKCVLVVVDNGICEDELKTTLQMCSEIDGITVVKTSDLKDFINGRI